MGKRIMKSKNDGIERKVVTNPESIANSGCSKRIVGVFDVKNIVSLGMKDKQ